MIASAIISTLTYSDHFGFPLTLSELHYRLIKEKISNQKGFRNEIQKLLSAGVIEKKGDYYFLAGRSSLVSLRKEMYSISNPQIIIARRIAEKIGKVPGIMAVYLTGSLAMSNSDETADIDLMIITKNSRLWTTRLLLTLYTELLGLRRRPNSTQNSGKVCLNLYLSPKSYALPPLKRSLYSAYELIQAIPLYDPHNTHPDLLLRNHWIKNYLPNSPSGPGPESLEGTDNISTGPGPVGRILESICYNLQLRYMRDKITREYITKDSAYFHPNNPGAKVLKKLL